MSPLHDTCGRCLVLQDPTNSFATLCCWKSTVSGTPTKNELAVDLLLQYQTHDPCKVQISHYGLTQDLSTPSAFHISHSLLKDSQFGPVLFCSVLFVVFPTDVDRRGQTSANDWGTSAY